MAFELLKRQRPIVNGPGAKDWADGTTVELHHVTLSVRGLTSDCECAGEDRCQRCERSRPVPMLLIGVFNPDCVQQKFIFWGLIAENSSAFHNFVHQSRVDYPIPPNTQIVYGWYSPYLGSDRGWIKPALHSIDELLRMFGNTNLLRRTFTLKIDDAARAEAEQLGERILFPPNMLWAHLQSGKEFKISLRHVQSTVEGEGFVRVKGAESAPPGFIFKVTLRVVTKNEHLEIFNDAWINVLSDGVWDYIWVKNPDQEIPQSFVQRR